MDEYSGAEATEGRPGAVAAVGAVLDVAADLGHTSAKFLLARAEAMHLAYRTALTVPQEFARGSRLSRSEASDLAERSIRAEFAVRLRVSEREASKVLDHALLLVEDLPRTRALLAEGRLLWESGEIIGATAATLPTTSRAVFDERAAEVAPEVTPTQLRRIVARLREELHEEPLTRRHVRARQDRAVWVAPEVDGMATLCALLPAPDAMGIADRVDRIARILRDGGDERTLAQLKADVFTDLLRDGDIAGTTPAAPAPPPGRRPTTLSSGATAERRPSRTSSPSAPATTTSATATAGPTSAARTAASSGPPRRAASSPSADRPSPAPRRAPASRTHRRRSDGRGSRYALRATRPACTRAGALPPAGVPPRSILLIEEPSQRAYRDPPLREAAPARYRPAGFDGVRSQVSKKAVRSWPETDSARSCRSAVVTFP
ncbi:DUF222 domain-containing protein [Rathayibacter sp. VKM Ac-2835]|nr:DUF222 domain-containing protein [Rathayibacter sp. VKM Ac-2835]NRG39334.1 DUF222 domain-containing protein [Rathayibacter sp. VKM Ac-2835]